MEDEYEEDIYNFQVLGYDVKVKDYITRRSFKSFVREKKKCNFDVLLFGYVRNGNCRAIKFKAEYDSLS